MELFLAWIVLTAAWIRLERNASIEGIIVSLFAGAIISAILIYFLMIPALGAIIIPLAAIIFVVLSFLCSQGHDSGVSGEQGIVIVIACAVGLLALAMWMFGGGLFAGELYGIPHVTEVQNGSAKEIYIRTPGSGTLNGKTGIGTVGEEVVSTNHIRTVPKESAEWKASKSVGEYGYKFKASDAHVQFRDGEIKWLVPLEYDSDYKAWVYGDDGINGYVSVSAEDAQKAPERILGYKMKFVPSGVFGNNLFRKIYFKYPDYYQKESVFQLDDTGKPIYVTMLTKPTIWYTGEVPKGVVVTDTETGAMEYYEMDKIPPYINRAMDESLTEDYLVWWGAYIHGFWNTVFSERDVKVPTGGLMTTTHEGGEVEISAGSPDVYLVYGMDNRLYWFGTITSKGNSLSMVGYTLTDVTTGNTTFYKTEGYYNDISAAKNVQQHADVSKVMGYKASQPIMYVLYDEETWIIPVLASTNEVKAFGIVHAKSGTTFVRERLADVLTDYRAWLIGTTPAGIRTTLERIPAQDTNFIAMLIIQNGQSKQEIPIYKNTTLVIKGREE